MRRVDRGWIRWSSGDARAAEGLLAGAMVLVAVLGIAVPLATVGLGLGGGRDVTGAGFSVSSDGVSGQISHDAVDAAFSVPVQLSAGTDALAVDSPRIAGPVSAQVAFPHPSGVERVLYLVPVVVPAALALSGLALVLGVVRSLRRDSPFTDGNTRRLTALAVVLAVGGTAAGVVAGIARIELLRRAGVADTVDVDASFSFLPLYVGLVVGGLAEVFRRGAAMRRELEGLV